MLPTWDIARLTTSHTVKMQYYKRVTNQDWVTRIDPGMDLLLFPSIIIMELKRNTNPIKEVLLLKVKKAFVKRVITVTIKNVCLFLAKKICILAFSALLHTPHTKHSESIVDDWNHHNHLFLVLAYKIDEIFRYSLFKRTFVAISQQSSGKIKWS